METLDKEFKKISFVIPVCSGNNNLPRYISDVNVLLLEERNKMRMEIIEMSANYLKIINDLKMKIIELDKSNDVVIELA
jgi:hypothetical protein